MKKIQPFKKAFIVRSAFKKHKHDLRRKDKKHLERLEKLPLLIKERRKLKFISNYQTSKHELCIAPETFSLRDDPMRVIGYFEKAREALKQDIPVFLDLSQVKQMGPETLTYLCALIKEEEFNNKTVLQGNIPINATLEQMFIRSGFYKFVLPRGNINNIENDVSGELIHRITRQKVEPELAGEVCRSSMKHTFNSDDFTKQSFYPILIECMGNTHNHANYGRRDEIYNWWLLAYKEPITQITKFCFLDLGVGIFGSLEKKYIDNKLTGWLRWFTPENNIATLQKIFKGEKKTTATELPGRGLGLNNIFNLVKKDKTIHNFTLLSNDILATFGYNTSVNIQKIDGNFMGTLYYWELRPLNE